MYVGSDKCWSASMMATQWKEVEKSLDENNQKLKEITEDKKTKLEVSLEMTEKNRQETQELDLKKENLLDMVI